MCNFKDPIWNFRVLSLWVHGMRILEPLDDNFYCFKFNAEEDEDSNRNWELNGAFELNWEQLGFWICGIYWAMLEAELGWVENMKNLHKDPKKVNKIFIGPVMKENLEIGPKNRGWPKTG